MKRWHGKSPVKSIRTRYIPKIESSLFQSQKVADSGGIQHRRPHIFYVFISFRACWLGTFWVIILCVRARCWIGDGWMDEWMDGRMNDARG